MSAEIDSLSPTDFNPELLAWVRARVSGRMREGVSAATLTTLATGGELRVVVTVESVQELRELLVQLHAERQLVRVIGNGSNLLVSDHGVQGWVIRLGAAFRTCEKVTAHEFQIGASASLMSLARRLSEEGYSGLEFAAGIPASCGGATFMNAGAHGADIGERIVSVCGIELDGTPREWKRGELTWSYRSSGLPAGFIVTSLRLKLTPGDRTAIADLCRHNLDHRKRTQPLSQPSAGSIFRNPSPSQPAGRVLDEAGMKGVRYGGALVSELHANWIVNPNREATAREVYTLIRRCQDRAREVCGVVLEPEVNLWGRLSE